MKVSGTVGLMVVSRAEKLVCHSVAKRESPVVDWTDTLAVVC